MARAVVHHVAVREGEAFDLDPHEQIISAEYEHPWMHLIVLWTETALIDGSPETSPDYIEKER